LLEIVVKAGVLKQVWIFWRPERYDLKMTLVLYLYVLAKKLCIPLCLVRMQSYSHELGSLSCILYYIKCRGMNQMWSHFCWICL